MVIYSAKYFKSVSFLLKISNRLIFKFWLHYFYVHSCCVEMTQIFKIITLLSFVAMLTPTFLYAVPASNLYNTTFSILSYAKWEHDTPKLCVIDNNVMAQQFKNAKHSHHNYDIHSISLRNIAQSNCQIVIFSTLSSVQEQHTLNTQVQFPALSISMNNLECETGSAFCIYKKNQNYAFKVNMESLTQSKVHIDPRVLLLANTTEPNS